jgi:hypothetical protein
MDESKARDWTSAKSWRKAVELYTSLDLTWEQDRLAAFFGFANFYARVTGALITRDYFSGLWDQSLRLDLLWRVNSLDYLDSRLGMQDAERFSQTVSDVPGSEQNEEKTAVQSQETTGTQLASKKIHNREPEAVPSWSWVAARTRVNYWHDLEMLSGSRSLRRDNWSHYHTRDLFGTARPGVLSQGLVDHSVSSLPAPPERYWPKSPQYLWL